MNKSAVRIPKLALKFKIDLTAYRYWNVHEVERPARQRRTVLFAKTTRLLPIDNRLAHLFADLVRTKVGDDHLTVWIDESGTLFTLNEPYDHIDGGDLSDDKYVSILLPAALSPYCGGYSAKPDAKPGTRSYLICSAEHAEKLKVLCARLEFSALTAPAWNTGAPA